MSEKQIILRLRDRHQLTLPAEFAKYFDLSVGDGLVASVSQHGIHLRPLRIAPADSARSASAVAVARAEARNGEGTTLDPKRDLDLQLREMVADRPVRKTSRRPLTEEDIEAIVRQTLKLAGVEERHEAPEPPLLPEVAVPRAGLPQAGR